MSTSSYLLKQLHHQPARVCQRSKPVLMHACAQAWVGVVPVGPAGRALNSSFANRDSQAYKEDLGNAVVNLARMVPDGLLVFFPAYAVLRECLDAWKAAYGTGQAWGSSIWERITAHKQPVVEPQVSAVSEAASNAHRTQLLNPVACDQGRYRAAQV